MFYVLRNKSLIHAKISRTLYEVASQRSRKCLTPGTALGDGEIEGPHTLRSRGLSPAPGWLCTLMTDMVPCEYDRGAWMTLGLMKGSRGAGSCL